MSDGPLIKNTAAEKIAAATKLPAVSTASTAKLPAVEAAPFSFFREFNEAANKLAKNSPVTEFKPSDIANLETIHRLLGPDKFGGRDGRFGHDDVRAIALALIKANDTEKEIKTKVREEFNKQADPRINNRRGGEGGERFEVGKRTAARVANRIFQKNQEAYNQQGREMAFTMIVNELTSGLEKAGQPKPVNGIGHDMTPRTVTKADADAFKAAIEAATAKQRAIAAKYPEFPAPDASKVTQGSLAEMISQIRAGLKLVNNGMK